MRLVRVASASLLALATAIAADAAPQPAPAAAPAPAVAPAPAAAQVAPPPAPAPQVPREYTAQATHTIAVSGVGDAKQLSKIALHVTEDGGKTWRKAQEVPVLETATAIPSFTFTAERDGTYGLWTVSTTRSGHAEAEPVAGLPPKSELVVDRAAPTLDSLEATLGGVSAGQATLAVSWKISDPNLGKEPVSIEVSTDLGKSFAAKAAGAADGTTGLAIPIADDASEVQVRLIGRDLAGNVLTSPARSVALPVKAKPADPEAQLAAAVAALPKPDELGTAPRGGSPIVTAGGESPLADAAVKPAAAGTGTAVAASAKPAAASAKPDTAAKPDAEAPPVAGQDVETRYARAANPATRTPVSDESPARAPATARAVAPDPDAAFLVGADADRALDKAQAAQRDGDTDGALAQYLRLHNSSVAKDALAAELALLRSVGDHRTIAGIADALPPELRTDTARLAAARANLELGNADAAITWASRVRANAPEAREALFVLGKGLKAKGRDAESKRVFARLASGDDEIAAQARAEQ